MSDFTPIETQEQLDKIIGERVKRAERAAAEKYADYETLKTQNAQLQAQLQAQAETISGHQAEVDTLNSKIHTYEIGSVKTKVAAELGIPYQMAERLTGEDEETIRADAESMMKLIGRMQVAPLGSPEPITDTNNNDPEAVARKKFENWMKDMQQM